MISCLWQFWVFHLNIQNVGGLFLFLWIAKNKTWLLAEVWTPWVRYLGCDPSRAAVNIVVKSLGRQLPWARLPTWEQTGGESFRRRAKGSMGRIRAWETWRLHGFANSTWEFPIFHQLHDGTENGNCWFADRHASSGAVHSPSKDDTSELEPAKTGVWPNREASLNPSDRWRASCSKLVVLHSCCEVVLSHSDALMLWRVSDALITSNVGNLLSFWFTELLLVIAFVTLCNMLE